MRSMGKKRRRAQPAAMIMFRSPSAHVSYWRKSGNTCPRLGINCCSRICLLLAFGCNGAFGTAHEPSVGRYTGYGRGLFDGELKRLRHAQQDGARLIAGLGDVAKHLLDLVGVQRLALCPSKSFFAL